MKHSHLMTSFARRVAVLALCVAGAALSGCAISPSTSTSLVPSTISASNKHPQKVGVAVAGFGSHAIASKHLTDATVTDALVTAIQQSQTFASVVRGEGGDYQLNVTLISAEYPSFGASFTVKSEMAWSLKRADGKSVWQESIKSEGLATAGEAFAGTERVRMAAERSFKANIAAGLEKLSALKL